MHECGYSRCQYYRYTADQAVRCFYYDSQREDREECQMMKNQSGAKHFPRYTITYSVESTESPRSAKISEVAELRWWVVNLSESYA